MTLRILKHAFILAPANAITIVAWCTLPAMGNMLLIGAKQGLTAGTVNSVTTTDDGMVAVGTKHGLFLWKNGKMRHYTGDWFNPHLGSEGRIVPGNSALPGNNVRDCAVTGNGTLWIGVQGGLARFRNGRIEDMTSALRSAWVRAEGRPTEFIKANQPWRFVWRVYANRGHGLWVGTRGGGVFRWDKKHGEFRLIRGNGQMNQWVEGFAQAPDGKLYIDIFHLGVFTYDHGKLVRLRLGAKEKDVRTDQARAISIGKHGDLWISCNHGLWVRNANRWLRYRGAPNGPLPADYVWQLTTDKAGRVWVRTDGGDAVKTSKGWRYPTIATFKRDECPRCWIGHKGHFWVADDSHVARDPKITW